MNRRTDGRTDGWISVCLAGSMADWPADRLDG